jgi:hypothetical protein
LDLGGSLVWVISIDTSMDSVFIEIVSELSKPVLEISRVPEEELIKILAPNSSD